MSGLSETERSDLALYDNGSYVCSCADDRCSMLPCPTREGLPETVERILAERTHRTGASGETATMIDGLPTLSKGAHSPDDGEACVMEYVALLAGEEWTDTPSCTHPVLARTAQVVNDRLPDSERHRLVPLIGRLFGTAPSGTEHERKVLSVRLAAWCARRTLHLVPVDLRTACERAIDTAEAWCRGEATVGECWVYANAAAADADDAYAFAAYANTAANAAAAAAYVAYAAAAAAVGVDDAAYNAAAAAAYAYNAAYNANAAADSNAAYAAAFAAYANAAYAADADDAAALSALLSDLLDEYDRLAGRTQYREVTDAELHDLAQRARIGGGA